MNLALKMNQLAKKVVKVGLEKKCRHNFLII